MAVPSRRDFFWDEAFPPRALTTEMQGEPRQLRRDEDIAALPWVSLICGDADYQSAIQPTASRRYGFKEVTNRH